MKNNRKNLLLLNFALLAATLLLFVSCKKSGEEIVEFLSESEAAEIAEAAISSRSAGAAMPTVDAAQIIESQLYNCNVPGDTTFQKSNSNAYATYQYIFGLEWLLTCNNLGVPQSATVGISGNGTFATAHWEGTDTANGNLTFTGFNPQEPAFIANGSYTLAGDLTGDLRRVDPSFDCTTDITLVNLGISKTTYDITGGSGTIQITATNGQGTSRTLHGTLIFNGDGTVTVTVNGHTHTFPL